MTVGKGSVFVVSAPSGAGKTTLCRLLAEGNPRIVHSVSYTTRKARPGEVNGRDYFFIDEEGFMDMVRRGDFLEWAEVHGNLYGTSRVKLYELIENGNDVVLDIDTQGAAQIRAKDIGATFVFILPPSMKVLRERLTLRKTDSDEVIERRMRRALKEIADYNLFDYVIVNDRLEDALDDLRSVVLSRRVHISRVDHGMIRKAFELEISG